MLTQIVPAIKDQLTPEMWAEFMKYSPLPDSLSVKLRELITNAEQSQQQQIISQLMEHIQGMEGQMRQAGFQVDMEGKMADIRKTMVETEQKQVETVLSATRPDPNPQVVM